MSAVSKLLPRGWGRARKGARVAEAFRVTRRAYHEDLCVLERQLQDAPERMRGACRDLHGQAVSDHALAAALVHGATDHHDPEHREALERAGHLLDEARWALAAARAEAAGRRRPEDHAPCFFNAQHGPASTTVRWAPPGGACHEVSTCAADATRISQGTEPDLRLVHTGEGWVPWYQLPRTTADGCAPPVVEQLDTEPPAAPSSLEEPSGRS
ncbi:hypothetical protein [Nocardioides bruguierae]|uniref:Uncharacterized protein n=1 Tax=Nocardioides bruguierae TaxID=2945102 RepID=A0A9X2IFH0_9ACTN|nr:hypothetical protein [Nocardioides bruguierae]MCL8025236.1 hypothetical protein [Nocardioides bruguierae]MCM0621307.1 hypothetical protein [Nocardioides bruguierae]